MLVLRHLERIGRRLTRPVLTLGNFDGVHCGHQAILRRLVERARAVDGTAVVLTFEPHPIAVLAPHKAPPLLTDWRTRIERLAASGVDTVIVERFTPTFAALEAAEFVERLLCDGLGVHSIIVGHRVRFGHARRGDAQLLQDCAASRGVAVDIVGPVQVNGVEVSSSAIRKAIDGGDLGLAGSLLGHPHLISGRVVHGRHRGRTLGFPTANLRYANLALPPDGVYAVRARIGERWIEGVANIGNNPTFAEAQRSFEVHLFDFDADIYGRRIEVALVQQLRGEIKFADVQALVQQIGNDAAAARRILATAQPE